MMDLYLSSLGAGSSLLYVLCKASKFTLGLTHDMVFASTLIWYYAHKQIYTQHTQGPIDWPKYILTPPVMCS